MKLITLAQAKLNLRMDQSYEDADIEMFIEAASEAVVNYLKSAADAYLDTTGEPVPIIDTSATIIDYAVPAVWKQATKYLVNVFAKNRAGEDDGESSRWREGFLPPPVTALLYPLRSPALA